MNASQSQEVDSDDNSDNEEIEDVDSDAENFYSGDFFQCIKQAEEKAVKERNYLMKELRSKERRGCIFYDKINRVVAAVQRSEGKYDYLIEWKRCKKD